VGFVKNISKDNCQLKLLPDSVTFVHSLPEFNFPSKRVHELLTCNLHHCHVVTLHFWTSAHLSPISSLKITHLIPDFVTDEDI